MNAEKLLQLHSLLRGLRDLANKMIGLKVFGLHKRADLQLHESHAKLLRGNLQAIDDLVADLASDLGEEEALNPLRPGQVKVKAHKRVIKKKPPVTDGDETWERNDELSAGALNPTRDQVTPAATGTQLEEEEESSGSSRE